MKPANLVRSGTIVGFMTLLSRVLGFVRDQILAIVFGAGATTDVFLVAFKIPNFLRRLFAEGAFATAFVPVFTEYKETRSKAALVDLAAHVSGTLTIILLLVSTLGVMLSPLLIMLFAPGFIDEPERFDLATRMLRITFPYLFFISLVAYAGSMLNTFGKFAVPSFTPVLLNICMIAAALIFSPFFSDPIVALAWGVFAAGAVQLFLQLPFLRQIGLMPRPRWGWKHPGVRRILKLMVPAILGSSVAQINLLLDTVIASFLTAGSLSWLYYSDRMLEFPLGMLGVTLGTIILPRLAREHSLNSPDDFRRTLDWAIRLVLILGLPAGISLMILAEPMLLTLFGYGEFKASDATMASYSLIAYGAGLPAFLLIKIFAPAFYARQNTRTPVRIGIIALITNMVYNLLFVLPMIWMDFIAPHTGLALASSLSAWQQAIMLYRKLGTDDIYQISPEVWAFARRSLGAVVALTVVLLLFASIQWQSFGALGRLSLLAGVIAGGALTYALGLLLAGIRPQQLASP
ncbi:murein biosynthesis integral membrane protein MurJ [Granulosicoccus antarcticus]|uniref:Probable lipid II flippase MurJ n=1 Tax=Granulosicoccus antarcticus IMCC3135 TaxID=1192854 RepID=A0A2Z2NH44_9GAMM|nr:murein biosynthesis integral membrane protein MurJ [Granulosicoccus antarcticus]ASJ70449.1 Putative lipid II flippase MurJ [Granulosicoccus antarcticus IMCC3135]